MLAVYSTTIYFACYALGRLVIHNKANYSHLHDNILHGEMLWNDNVDSSLLSNSLLSFSNSSFLYISVGRGDSGVGQQSITPICRGWDMTQCVDPLLFTGVRYVPSSPKNNRTKVCLFTVSMLRLCPVKIAKTDGQTLEIRKSFATPWVILQSSAHDRNFMLL